VEQSDPEPRLALNFLSYMISHTALQEKTLAEIKKSPVIIDTLGMCKVDQL